MSAKLEIIGSGSSGNGYVISCGSESLVLELGMRYNDYIGPWSHNICACLVSHSHGDHLNINTAKKFMKYGTPIFSNEGVKEAFGGATVLKEARKYRIGEKFLVQPFSVPHSVENYAYLIEHEDFGRLVFATDCESFDYQIKNVDHWIIEANYSDDIVVDRELYGEETNPNTFTHLSFEQCMDALTRNNSCKMKTVVLIHLSDGNSDARLFRSSLSNELCIDDIYIAERGMSIPLKKDFF